MLHDKEISFVVAVKTLHGIRKVVGGDVLLMPKRSRLCKEWYIRRTALLIDSDPVRTNGEKKSNATDVEKAAARKPADDTRRFLCGEMQWPQPILCDSGNGYHQRYEIDLPNDQASEDLIRSVLTGLAAKFDNDQSHVDCGVFEANRVTKLPGTWARKAPESEGRPWRESCILEVPEREIELPARAGEPRQTVKELALEPVARSLIESAVSHLPALQKSSTGLEMSQNDVVKYEWLRSFLSQFNVPILAERASAKRLLLDVICPWEEDHAARLESPPPRSGMVVGTAMVFRVSTASARKSGGGGLTSEDGSILKVPPSPIYLGCRLMQPIL